MRVVNGKLIIQLEWPYINYVQLVVFWSVKIIIMLVLFFGISVHLLKVHHNL